MKFNWINKGMNKVLNKESAPAYRLTPEWELYTSVVTTSLNNSFYEQEEERIERVRTLIGKCNPLFVAQLAAYARETMNLRSIPLVMAVELARIHQGDNLVKRVTARTVRRADEITELLACYQQPKSGKATAWSFQPPFRKTASSLLSEYGLQKLPLPVYSSDCAAKPCILVYHCLSILPIWHGKLFAVLLP